MQEEIEVGDKVRHKTLHINGGLAMNVSETTDQSAFCDYFDGQEAIHKQIWFDKKDLIIVSKGVSGFID